MLITIVSDDNVDHGCVQGNEHLGQKESQEFRTPTVTKTTDPVWNARAPDFIVHNPNTLLRVQVRPAASVC
jgi:hypothetical protein